MFRSRYVMTGWPRRGVSPPGPARLGRAAGQAGQTTPRQLFGRFWVTRLLLRKVTVPAATRIPPPLILARLPKMSVVVRTTAPPGLPRARPPPNVPARLPDIESVVR